MTRGIGTARRVALLVLALLAAGAVAACGSSSSTGSASGADAQTLLKQTFTGSHSVKSGVISFNLTVTPSGSTVIQGPISLTLSGPFQSRGSGKLPASNFSVSIDALGHHGQLGVISTGTAGYVTLDGTAYQLPAADFQKLDSSFSGAAGGAGTGGLSKLGIDPMHWLTNPTVVGNENVGGTSTTHVRAGINVAALLNDVNTFLQKAAATGATGTTGIPSSLSPSTRQTIANSVKNPTVDVWTGTSDKTLRKLSINLNIPVSGKTSTTLGGITSAGVGLTLQYTQLNHPQVIAPPSNVQPFSGFTTKLQSILQSVAGLGAGGLGSIGTGTGSSGSSGSASSGSTTNITKYTSCIQAAKGDVSKMQKCASLLNSSSGG
jgi:hypothetical protein